MSEKNQQAVWQGRIDSEDGEAGKRWHQIVNSSQGESGFALVGLACDLGVIANKGRAGAAQGPASIRTALANMAWRRGMPLFDIGDTRPLANLESTQQVYAKAVAASLNQHKFVMGLGGGHEIAWGSYQGYLNAISDDSTARIGIINFDAHFDLRKPAPETSSGTPFLQIAELCQRQNTEFNYACLGVSETANTPALFATAEGLGVHYLRDLECDLATTQDLLRPFLEGIDHLYLTICLDAFPACAAPGVSAPSNLGIDVRYVIRTIRWLASQQAILKYSWRLADVAEMNPNYDIDSRTAKLAARLIYEIHRAVS